MIAAAAAAAASTVLFAALGVVVMEEGETVSVSREIGDGSGSMYETDCLQPSGGSEDLDSSVLYLFVFVRIIK